MLKASDVVGNKTIADKTKAWNQANPELRRQLNKNAAQGCMTREYRKAQRERMYKYDEEHPQRCEGIAAFSRAMWENAVDVKRAISEFTKKQPNYVNAILAKERTHKALSEYEQRIIGGFWQNFWLKHPELKTKMFEVADIVRNSK